MHIHTHACTHERPHVSLYVSVCWSHGGEPWHLQHGFVVDTTTQHRACDMIFVYIS